MQFVAIVGMPPLGLLRLNQFRWSKNDHAGKASNANECATLDDTCST